MKMKVDMILFQQKMIILRTNIAVINCIYFRTSLNNNYRKLKIIYKATSILPTHMLYKDIMIVKIKEKEKLISYFEIINTSTKSPADSFTQDIKF